MGLVHGIMRTLFPPAPELVAELTMHRAVTVRGRVVPRDLLSSPLDGATCVYYRYAVEEFRRSHLAAGVGEGFWGLSEHDEAIAEFYLEDDSGRAIVAPHHARIERSRQVQLHRVDLGIDTRRASQLLIRPGDTVEVSAIAEPADDLYDDARDYRARANRVILRAPEGGELLIRILSESDDTTGSITESVATSP